MSAPLPPPLREAERLSALYRYEILDSPPEKELDDLVHLAAYICQTPIALISLVDSDRQWFKSKIRLNATETSRIVAFCAHTILGSELMVVSDALADERFADNPLVTGEPHIRFYGGAPLVTPEGFRIGTLSVIDHVPRDLSGEQREALRVLSRQVMDHLTLDREHRESIHAVNERQRTEQSLRASELKFKQLSETTSSAIYIYTGDRFLYANPAAASITGYELHELRAMSLWDLVHPDFQSKLKARVQAIQKGDRSPARIEFTIVRKDGAVRWLDFTAASIEFGGQQARIGTAYDITERKQAEELKTFQQRFLENVLLPKPLTDTMNDLVQSVESLSNGGICSILLLHQESGTLRRGAVSSLPEAFNRAVDGTPVGPRHGSCGTAAYRKAPVIVTDIATDPLWTPWGEITALALQAGLRACTSVPILNADGAVLGTYAMYFSTARRPTDFELEMLDAAGQVLSIAIEWKRTDDALRTSESRMDAILNNSPLMVFLKDRDGKYLFTNRMFNQRFGFSRDEAIGKTDDELFPAPQAASFRRHDREAMQAGKSVECEETAQYADGLHTSIVVKFPLRDAEGIPAAVCGIVTDITERKKAEERARRWEQVFEKAEFGLAHVTVTDNTFVAVNAAFAKLLGFTGDELAGRPILSIYPSEEHEAMKTRLRELDRCGHLVFESVHQRKDGTTFPVLADVTIIKDAEGRPVSRVAHVLDITERRNTFDELKQAHRRLQMLIREVRVAEERERRRLSRELHDEFGQLLSALKFDLSAIGSAIRTLPSPPASRARKGVVQATHTVDRLFESFREVLAALRPAVLDVLGLIPGIRALAKELQERTGLRCHVVAGQENLGQQYGPEIESSIYRMVQELLMNVSLHAQATLVTVTLGLKDGGATVAVEDDGQGFDVRRVQETGRFGLRGIRERAELLGGTVSIRSEQGKGTVVSIRLPCQSAVNSRGSAAAPRTAKAPQTGERRRHGKTV